jgi:uncharacterized protein (TIGR02145 family)
MRKFFKTTLKSQIIACFVTIILFVSCDKNEEQDIDLKNCDCNCDEKFGSFTDTRDGHVYKTIKIGDQIWMAENLAYLPEVNTKSDYSDFVSKYYVYEYSGSSVSAAKATENYKIYGVLYNWPAAMKSCPPGWHLPSDDEWTILEEHLIANGYNYDSTLTGNKIAKALSSTTDWEYFSSEGAIGDENISQNNRSCFSALPGGLYGIGMDFSRSKSSGYWWSSTLNDQDEPLIMRLRSCDNYFRKSESDKESGLSVRCLKD